MAKVKIVSVEEKLRALYDLQLIDSRIDEIKSIQGELPLEIEDLQDEIIGLNNRLEKLQEDMKTFKNDIKDKESAIQESKSLMERYEEQQKNVRNNREFVSLSKEIEYQELEIQLAQKRIKEYKAKIELKNETIAETKEAIKREKELLADKKSELKVIIKENEKEEKVLMKKSEEFSKLIEGNLLKAYQRIRNSVKNGLAVVSLKNGATEGSFFTIPPQRQAEIASRKKIITDEHSGRILVDSALAEEEREKINSIVDSL